MQEVLLIMFLLVSVVLIILILLQQGKGADMGASFGAGASATLFGSSGSASFLTRLTAFLGAMYFVLSLVLGVLSGKHTQDNDTTKWDNIPSMEQSKGEANSNTVAESPNTQNNDIPH